MSLEDRIHISTRSHETLCEWLEALWSFILFFTIPKLVLCKLADRLLRRKCFRNGACAFKFYKSGRSALASLLESCRSTYPQRNRILIPDYICNVVPRVCKERGFVVVEYRTLSNNLPDWDDVVQKVNSDDSILLIASMLGTVPYETEGFSSFCEKFSSVPILADECQYLITNSRVLESKQIIAILFSFNNKSVPGIMGGGIVIPDGGARVMENLKYDAIAARDKIECLAGLLAMQLRSMFVRKRDAKRGFVAGNYSYSSCKRTHYNTKREAIYKISMARAVVSLLNINRYEFLRQLSLVNMKPVLAKVKPLSVYALLRDCSLPISGLQVKATYAIEGCPDRCRYPNRIALDFSSPRQSFHCDSGALRVFHINANYAANSLHAILVHTFECLGLNNLVYCPIPRKDYVIRKKEDVDFRENALLDPVLGRADRFLYFHRLGKMFCHALTAAKEFQPKLLHAYTLFGDGGVAYKLNRRLGIPYVVAVRNSDVNTYFKYMKHLRWYGERILLGASKVFFLSESYRDKVLEGYVSPSARSTIVKKSMIVPNGIKSFWLENLYWEREFTENRCIRVVSIGDIDQNKNIETIARALEQLIGKGYQVSLDVASEVCHKKVLQRLQQYEFFNFHGLIGKKDLMELYRQSDVFALVSFHESFGAVYPEAMSQGLPIVYTKGEGFDGWFKEGEVGYSANPHDVEDVAEKIEMAFLHRKEIAPRSIAGARRFDWTKISQQYVKLYKEIVS